MLDRYTPQQIAAATGIKPRTVRAYLLDHWRGHERGQWWRLSPDEYQYAIGQLRAAARCGTRQARREINKRGPFLPLF